MEQQQQQQDAKEHADDEDDADDEEGTEAMALAPSTRNMDVVVVGGGTEVKFRGGSADASASVSGSARARTRGATNGHGWGGKEEDVPTVEREWYVPREHVMVPAQRAVPTHEDFFYAHFRVVAGSEVEIGVVRPRGRTTSTTTTTSGAVAKRRLVTCEDVDASCDAVSYVGLTGVARGATTTTSPGAAPGAPRLVPPAFADKAKFEPFGAGDAVGVGVHFFHGEGRVFFTRNGVVLDRTFASVSYTHLTLPTN